MFARRWFPLFCLINICSASWMLASPADDNAERFKTEYARAVDLLAADKAGDALKSFEKADKLHGGGCGECRYQMAKIEMSSGEYDDCLRDLDKALPNLVEPKVQA